MCLQVIANKIELWNALKMQLYTARKRSQSVVCWLVFNH